MNTPEEVPTVPMVPLADLLALARLGRAMRQAQQAFFHARKHSPHNPSQDELIAAKRAEATFDAAVARVLAPPAAKIPGMEG